MKTSSKSELRKQQILTAAEKVFAKKGFQEATISDVGREAGLSEATIYEYFSSKEELLFSIPGETAKKTREDLKHILRHVRGAANKIRSIIYGYLWFYETHPDYASVSLLILKQNRKFLETQAYKDVKKLSGLLTEVLQEGKNKGEFSQEIDVYLVRSCILGTIEHNVIRRILLGKPQNLTDLTDPLTDLVLNGILKKPPMETMDFYVTVKLATQKKPAGPKKNKR